MKDKVEMTVASPQGGDAQVDPSSIKMFENDPTSTTFLNTQQSLWTNTHKLAEMVPKVGEFDAIFYVGGHGRESSFPPPPFRRKHEQSNHIANATAQQCST